MQFRNFLEKSKENQINNNHHHYDVHVLKY